MTRNLLALPALLASYVAMNNFSLARYDERIKLRNVCIKLFSSFLFTFSYLFVSEIFPTCYWPGSSSVQRLANNHAIWRYFTGTAFLLHVNTVQWHILGDMSCFLNDSSLLFNFRLTIRRYPESCMNVALQEGKQNINSTRIWNYSADKKQAACTIVKGTMNLSSVLLYISEM